MFSVLQSIPLLPSPFIYCVIKHCEGYSDCYITGPLEGSVENAYKRRMNLVYRRKNIISCPSDKCAVETGWLVVGRGRGDARQLTGCEDRSYVFVEGLSD